MPIYNVNLANNTCVSSIEIDHHLPIPQFMQAIIEAMVQFEDPRIDIECEDSYDLRHHSFTVSGTRQMTDAERNNYIADKAALQRYKEHMAKFEG